MAKPNYQFEKRQRDLAKKQKQEEKRRQKLAGKTAGDGGSDISGTQPEKDAADGESAMATASQAGGAPGPDTP